MGFTIKPGIFLKPLIVLIGAIFAVSVAAPAANANSNIIIEKASGVGVIKGIVRDDGGSPIADATVAIFRSGTSKLLKQVSSAADGSFLAKILPGTYTVLAVAEGFNPVKLLGVEVNRSAELVYGFRLERSGGGNTLPEKRSDRNSSKWRIRAAQSQRSIYQNREGDAPIDENSAARNEADESVDSVDPEGQAAKRLRQTVIETYFAGSKSGNYAVVNFATLLPIGEEIGRAHV